jgi:hypothetical protein
MKIHHVICLMAGSLCTLIVTTAWQVPNKALAAPAAAPSVAITTVELNRHPSQYDGKHISLTGYLEEELWGTEELLRFKGHAQRDLPYTLHPYAKLNRRYRIMPDKPQYTDVLVTVAQKDGSLTFHQDAPAAFSWQKRFGGRVLLFDSFGYESRQNKIDRQIRVIGRPLAMPFLGYAGLETIKGTWHWLPDDPETSYLELDN